MIKKRRTAMVAAAAVLCAAGSCVLPLKVQAAPSIVRVEKKAGGYQLTRNGAPYFIKGAGGDASKPMLKEIGGNSFRTWGAGGNETKLDEAQKLGMTVTIGMWLGHKEHGFDYHNADAVAKQLEDCKSAILKYKDHPALLMWGVGNEMEIGQGDDPAVWKAVEDIAAFAKKVDPNHPTMVVIAEIGGHNVENINKYCPDIDIIGINSYGGAPSIPERYPKAGGVKPYVLTEYGPPGTWETGKTSWGAAGELSSTEKAARYRSVAVEATKDPLCLGGYAFTWGFKQEATATWYGLFLNDGSRSGAVDALQEVWTGKPPSNRAPEIRSLKLEGKDKIAPGETVQATLDAGDPDKDPTKVKWTLQYDPVSYGFNGDVEAIPPSFPDAIVKSDSTSVTVKMPKYGGGYRLFAQVNDNHNGAAIVNVPLLVEGGEASPPPASQKAKLPFVLYDDEGGASPYITSGYMGDYGAIDMNAGWTQNPHSGKTALKVQFTKENGWGGVVWQSPANDWGDKPGGWDISGAKKLTFWARGDKGGESVQFSFGVINNDKKYFDSGRGNIKINLSPDWKEYSIDLDGQDLSHIKSGFAWVVGTHGEAVTFYLDDIRYE